MDRMWWWEEAFEEDASVVRYSASAESEHPRMVWRVSEHHVNASSFLGILLACLLFVFVLFWKMCFDIWIEVELS